ncbi:hypothetical protein [Rhodoblastus sp.]|uniref:hypothetical protein n=1 Tax=Rhodoblastus sp. TaxID=1962975 RepID=UPI003F9E7E83
MLVVIRIFSLVIVAAVEHFRDGLAYPALIVAALLGWRGIGFYWLAAPILALAIAANQIYANATSSGKIAAAMGNFPFELMVFAFLSLVGYLAGLLWRRRGSSPAPR